MKLISEEISNAKFLKEEKNGVKSYFIEGVFLQANIKNKNGRIYPLDIMKKAVNDYTEAYIKQSRGFGELGHPSGPIINLDRVSHMIVSLTNSGNDFLGRAKILGTPNGMIVKNLLDEGCQLGVSSRGLGSIEESGDADIVQSDFFLATAADIVADPSAPSAFVNGIMEGREFTIRRGGKLEVFDNDRIKKQVRNIPSARLQEEFVKIFDQFLRGVSDSK